jgi:hypothetical protein
MSWIYWPVIIEPGLCAIICGLLYSDIDFSIKHNSRRPAGFSIGEKILHLLFVQNQLPGVSALTWTDEIYPAFIREMSSSTSSPSQMTMVRDALCATASSWVTTKTVFP